MALRIGARALTLCAAVALTMIVLLIAIPDGNDVAETHLDKHARLRSISSTKIVFVGGSNLMYGLNSEVIESRLGMSAVNMGLNGYLGPRFLLNEVKDDLRPSDVVVLSFEYEAYFEPTPYNSVEGAGVDHLMLVKLRPESARYLETWAQYRGLVLAVPRVVQAKLFRLIEEWKEAALDESPRDAAEAFMANVEIRAGFNRYGDLVSHLDVAWPFPLWEEESFADAEVSETLLQLIAAFCLEMHARGVTVLLAPPPAPREWYAANQRPIESAFSRLENATTGTAALVIGNPAAFVLPESYFFDSLNHVNGEGRELRTETLVAYLRTALEARNHVSR